MSTTDNRPVFLNLLRIHQPVTAVLSILHRISGVLMILSLPGLVYLLSLSLEDQAGFTRVAALLGSLPMRLLGVLFVWALSHHLLAGIRFMLLDFDVGITRMTARYTAWLVHGLALMTSLFAGWVMLGGGT
ncbi:MAG TPA: succinate dehydrogenase, cytochrome b556 subunit [Gammaproteobacteria bacterium]|nr:succinate dehydrogenase, cytochrome b556 subunit [Gammaproteobacteria bacterium]